MQIKITIRYHYTAISKAKIQNTEKFFKIRKYQTTLTASCDICMQVKKWPLELEVEQQIGSK